VSCAEKTKENHINFSISKIYHKYYHNGNRDSGGNVISNGSWINNPMGRVSDSNSSVYEGIWQDFHFRMMVTKIRGST
jgi:hypothetical protein